jgi:hypothetical protein
MTDEERELSDQVREALADKCGRIFQRWLWEKTRLPPAAQAPLYALLSLSPSRENTWQKEANQRGVGQWLAATYPKSYLWCDGFLCSVEQDTRVYRCGSGPYDLAHS